jgi:uncharacterized membrane protein
MQVYHLLLYKVWRFMQWSRQRLRFRQRESLTEATASSMVFIWSNWVLVGVLLLLKIPVLGSAHTSIVTELCLAASGLLGGWLVYWSHLRLVKSTRYQASAAVFAGCSPTQSWLANLGAFASLLGIYLLPWLAAKRLLH